MNLEQGYYGSPRWSWEILDCAMPMTFDTYSNCAHQCVYCFAYFQRAVGGAADDYLHHRVKAVDVEKVKRMFTEPDQHAKQFAWYIKRRMVMQWGGLSDGFDWYERKFRKSLELLRFFREIDYPVSISTKGTWFLQDPEYREVLQGAKNVHFKYSIITADAREAELLEAGTPSPDERFRALEELAKLGIGATTLRFRPFIIGVSDRHAEAMLRRAKDVGCYSATTEFLCLESRASGTAAERYRQISKVVGFDVWQFYRHNSSMRTGLLRLNYDLKRPYIKRMEDVCAEIGLPFFVSDAHHKEASAGGGCCGLPADGPLSNWNHGQFSHAMMLAKANGSVRWADIEEDAAGLKNIAFYKAEGYNAGNTRNRANRRYQTMYDYMKEMWNDVRSAMSPARYFGGALVPTGVDEDQNVVYTYNKPFIEMGLRVETAAQLLAMVDAQETRREDGGDMAHVAWPVYVLAGDTPSDLPAANALDDARMNYAILCETNKAMAFADHWPTAEIVVLASTNGRSGTKASRARAQEQVEQMSQEDGASGFWLIDGGVRGFLDSQGREVSARAALSAAEATGGAVGVRADLPDARATLTRLEQPKAEVPA